MKLTKVDYVIKRKMFIRFIKDKKLYKRYIHLLHDSVCKRKNNNCFNGIIWLESFFKRHTTGMDVILYSFPWPYNEIKLWKKANSEFNKIINGKR